MVRCSPQFRLRNTRREQLSHFDAGTKVFEDGVQLMHLNYLLAFDGVIASRGGIPLIDQGAIIGAIGSSGGTDSQDEVVSKAGAAVINKLPAEIK
jgi:glc operon protein GlcG